MGLGDVTAQELPEDDADRAAARRRQPSRTRSFIPHVCHDAIGVLAAVTVATACVLDGSITHGIAVVPARQRQEDLGRASDRRIQRRARGRSGQPAERHPRRAAAHRAADHARRGDGARLGLGRTSAADPQPRTPRPGKDRIDDHRRPRPLHHRAEGAGGLAQSPDRRPQGPVGRAQGQRARRSATTNCAKASSTNQLKKMQERGSDLTIFSPRASFMAHHIGDFKVSSTWAAICNELCYRVSRLFPDHFIGAAMLPQSPGVDPRTCIPETGEMRQGVRLRRHQPEPRPVGRALDLAAAVGPALVPDLREDGRVRHPGDDPRQHQLQRLLPHHRRALSERRHHGLHAVPDLGPVQGLPDAEVPDPARRRRGAVSLGPLPRPGAGAEEAAAEGPPAATTSSSTPASITSRASTC